MLALVQVSDVQPHPKTWIDVLRQAVRAEFQVEVYVASLGDPILFGDKCAISDCTNHAKGFDLCQSHLHQWKKHGRPEITTWSPPRHRDDHIAQKCAVVECIRAAVGMFCESHKASFYAQSALTRAEYALKGKMIDRWWAASNEVCVLPGCNFPQMPSKRQSKNYGFCDRHELNFKLCLGRNSDLTPETYVKQRGARRHRKYRFDHLAEIVRLEMQYALQLRHDERLAKWTENNHKAVVDTIVVSEVNSVLDWSLEEWSTFCHNKNTDIIAFLRFSHRQLVSLRDEANGTTVYDRDIWYFNEVGFNKNEPMCTRFLRFDQIKPEWFRNIVKRWIRWRINCGIRPNTLYSNVSHMQTFARLVSESRLAFSKPSDINRFLLVRYAEIIRGYSWTPHYRLSLQGSLQQLLQDVEIQRWEPTISSGAKYYHGELPKLIGRQPRFIPEYLMKQIEEEGNILQLGSFAQQTILRVMIGTGLRGVDVARLKIGAVLRDGQGNVMIKYINHKFNREAVTLCDESLVRHLEEQVKRSREKYPKTEWIFPRPQENPDGAFCYSTGTWRTELQTWLLKIDLRDESGQAATVSPHRFRHTYATRLINQGVPSDAISFLLNHKSLSMTETYATISLNTVRKAWERAKMVDIFGEVIPLTGEGPLRDAAWALHNISRAKQTLANGYCARPLQQKCPHPNACLTCPDFLTTEEFLPQHRKQYTLTLELIDNARAKGQDRLLAMNEPTLLSLQKIIESLENVENENKSDNTEA